MPVELLVYTQTSGDIPVLMNKIDQFARDSGQGKNVKIVVDSTDGFTWPWAWYLRDYKNVEYPAIQPDYQAPANAIVIANKNDASNVHVTGDYDQTPFHHRRWFPEDYRGADGRVFIARLLQGPLLRRASYWLDYWVRRTIPSPLGESISVAFFPKGYVDISQPAGPTSHQEGTQLVIGESGIAPGQLSGPSDVTFDSAGNIYVADTNNNRIQKYDPNGVWVASAGGLSSDLNLKQPWSVAVGADGTVFVADTWDHTIVKLDKDFNQVKTWGVPCTTVPDCDEYHLFGPREIVVTADNHVLVTDTGNGRVLEYDADGGFIRQIGSKAQDGDAPDPLKFNEPVGVVASASGDIYIADYWNRRIVHLDKDLQPKGEIQVPTWGSNQVTDRAYMALLPDGRLLVTDPNPCASPPNCSNPTERQDSRVRHQRAARRRVRRAG